MFISFKLKSRRDTSTVNPSFKWKLHEERRTVEDMDDTKHAVITDPERDVHELYPDKETTIHTTHVDEAEKARLRKLKKSKY